MRALRITIKELCDVVEGKASLDPNFLVKNLGSLEDAQGSDLAVVFDPEINSVFAPLSKEKILSSKAGAILASKEVVPEKNYIIVQDPLKALEKIERFLAAVKGGDKIGVHPTAVVGDFAVLEDGVEAGPNAVIMDDAKIGRGAKIGAGSFIGKGCQIGCYATVYPGVKILDRCVIGDYTIVHSGVVIGSDGFGYRITKQGLRKVPHLGIVRIGKHVEIGANCCIDRSEFDETVIGDGVKMDNGVHVAHNVKIGQGTAILAQTGIAGSVVIGVGCQIGGQVAIKDHVTIGNGAKIVSKSAVMRNVSDGEVVCGIPTMPFSQWKRMMVAMAKLPEYIKVLKGLKQYSEGGKKLGFWQRLFR